MKAQSTKIHRGTRGFGGLAEQIRKKNSEFVALICAICDICG